MITISPSAVKLLADLAERGIDLQPHGDAIRFRPRHAMTPTLFQRLQAHKAQLLAMAIIKLAQDGDDADLAERLAEAWEERIVICMGDGKQSEQAAEVIALEQLRMMLDTCHGVKHSV